MYSPVALMTASTEEAPPPDDHLIARLVGVAPPSIEVISAVPNWVELLIPCTRKSAETTQALVAKLEADLPHELIDSIRQALRELLLNAVEWGGKLDPSRKCALPACVTPGCCCIAWRTLAQGSVSKVLSTLRFTTLRQSPSRAWPLCVINSACAPADLGLPWPGRSPTNCSTTKRRTR